ncbi:MAG: hypothetical protein G01um101470_653, partial [Parcubacteria group bacterium Gr01-1014_70]
MNMVDSIKQELEESAAVKKLVASRLVDAIAKAAEIIIASYQTGGKLLL